MWIKSQNGEVICNTDIIQTFSVTDDGKEIEGHLNPQEAVILGVYNDKEESKEVIDRVIDAICMDATIYYMPKAGIVKYSEKEAAPNEDRG